MAIARIGTYRLPNRLLSSAKIRLSRGQKQIYLCFAEAEYLRRSQRLGLSRAQKQIYLRFAEAKYLKLQRSRAQRRIHSLLPVQALETAPKKGQKAVRRQRCTRNILLFRDFEFTLSSSYKSDKTYENRHRNCTRNEIK